MRIYRRMSKAVVQIRVTHTRPLMNTGFSIYVSGKYIVGLPYRADAMSRARAIRRAIDGKTYVPIIGLWKPSSEVK